MNAIIVNPGTEPIQAPHNGVWAALNVMHFIADVQQLAPEYAQAVWTLEYAPKRDYGGGYYAFTVSVNGRSVEVQMLGYETWRVRYTGEDGQNIWHYPRLYINGDSWAWKYALKAFVMCLSSEE